MSVCECVCVCVCVYVRNEYHPLDLRRCKRTNKKKKERRLSSPDH